MDINVINQNKVYRQAENFNSIDISVNGYVVKGLLQEPIEYSVEANYNTIFSLDSIFGSLDNVATLTTGTSLLKTGIFTKRFWKGGGYLRISPKIRVVDTEGAGVSLRSSIILLNSCLPTAKFDGAQLEGLLKTFFPEDPDGKDIARGVLSVGAGALAGAATGSIQAGIITGVGVNVLTKEGGIASFAQGLAANQPKPVFVQIGNYFSKEFVVENCNVKLSQELVETKEGKVVPLYADIDLTLGTQEIVTTGNLGMSLGHSRFKTEG